MARIYPKAWISIIPTLFQDGFNMSRAQPIVHKSNLKIGIEGERDYSPEKHQVQV